MAALWLSLTWRHRSSRYLCSVECCCGSAPLNQWQVYERRARQVGLFAMKMSKVAPGGCLTKDVAGVAYAAELTRQTKSSRSRPVMAAIASAVT